MYINRLQNKHKHKSKYNIPKINWGLDSTGHCLMTLFWSSIWLHAPSGVFHKLFRFGHFALIYVHLHVPWINRIFVYFGVKFENWLDSRLLFYSLSDFRPARTAPCCLKQLAAASVKNRPAAYSPRSTAESRFWDAYETVRCFLWYHKQCLQWSGEFKL